MVDLHQTLPGLPESHPWLHYPRWRMALHTFLGVLLTSMIGGLFAGISALPSVSGYMNILLIGAIGFGGYFAGFCAILAAVFGPRLRRYYPFSQALLFGGISTSLGFLTLLLVSVIDAAIRSFIHGEETMFDPLQGPFLLLFIFGLPAFLVASIGFALAVWSPTHRGTKVFWPLLGILGAIVVTLFVLHAMNPDYEYIGGDRATQNHGMSDGSHSREVRPGVCATHAGDGSYVEYPCDGLPYDQHDRSTSDTGQ